MASWQASFNDVRRHFSQEYDEKADESCCDGIRLL